MKLGAKHQVPFSYLAADIAGYFRLMAEEGKGVVRRTRELDV